MYINSAYTIVSCKVGMVLGSAISQNFELKVFYELLCYINIIKTQPMCLLQMYMQENNDTVAI